MKTNFAATWPIRSVTKAAVLATLAAFAGAAHGQQPLGTAFTYQGELASAGAPAAGTYDIRFRLYDAPTDGNQIGGMLCSDNLAVSAGRFGVSLDFGGVFTGQKQFLEIEVRQDAGLDCSDASGYTVLSPRQELTGTPNATFALTANNAGSAASLNGQPASFFTNAANLTGTLADGQLSSNVARLNGNQTFTGVMNFSNPANAFSGSFTGGGAGLTSLSGANINAGTLTRTALSGEMQSGLGTFAVDWGLSPYVRTGSVATGLNPFCVSVSGSFAYVVNQSQRTLQVFAVGDSGVPTLAGSVAIGEDAKFVAVSGSFAFVVCGNYDTSRLQVFNISNPAAPTFAGSIDTGSGSSAQSVAVSGSFAFVTCGGSSTLNAYHISNLGVPTLIGTFGTGAGSSPNSVAVSGSFAYVLSGLTNRLLVVDVSNPAAPTLAGSILTDTGPQRVAVLGPLAAVVNDGYQGNSTLQIFNISNPAAPALVGSAATALGKDVAISGSFAYVVGNMNSLQVFDISNPASPTLAGSIATGVGPRSVVASGFFAYVVSRFSGNLEVFSAPGRMAFVAPLAASALTGANGAGLTNLNAANITTGTLAPTQVPSLDASKITTGTLAAARIPNLDASKITSGTLDNARTSGTNLSTPGTLVQRDAAGNFAAGTITAAIIGNASTATTATQLNGQPGSFYTNASNITTGTLNTAQVPNLDASKITTGLLSPAQIPSLDASKVTTGTLSSLRIPSLDASKITSGTLSTAQVPSLDASKITSGTLADVLLSPNIVRLNEPNRFYSNGVTSFAGNVSIGTPFPDTQYALQVVSGGDTQIGLTGGPTTGGAIPARTWAIQSSGINSTPSNLNGTFQIIDRTASASRILIDTNGNVGIGTSAPGALLDLNTGSLGTANWQMVFNNTANTSFRGGARLANSGFFEMTNTAAAANPNFARLASTGAWTAVSDARLKTDVTSAQGNLAAAMKLRPVNFRWKTDGTQDFGMIAQEVREVMPMLVVGDESKEKLTVNYSQMSVVAIGAIQEQQQAITLLQAENAQLKARLSAIETALLKMSKDHK